MIKKLIISIAFVLSYTGIFAQYLSFSGGHSHNDYHQQRPLFEAWEHGMVSIEADIYLQEGKLLVGHSTNELNIDRTLESLYLQPLTDLIKKHTTSFKPIILLVDIKTDGEETYRVLETVLKKHSDILSEFNKGNIIQRQVTIIISGNRPVETLRAEQQRFAFIDGRIKAEDWNDSPTLIPLVSDSWSGIFTWKGEGNISENEFEKLKQLVRNCHNNHQMIRFWGIPNDENIRKKYWDVLTQAGVDLIGSDCPSCLEKYLKSL